MRKEMQRAQKDLKDFGSKMKTALGGIAAALGGIALGAGLGSAVEDAIKFEALMGTLSKTLGKSMGDFVKWQNTVGDAMGFSKLSAAEMGNNFSLRLKSIAKDEQDLLKKTTDLIKAAAIIRSRTGMSQIEISDRMRSAMNQEADGADELGVNVRVAAIQQSRAYKEMANNAPWEELSEGMKKTILYYHILDSTTANFGTEIAQNTALLKGGFTAALGDMRLALGQAFLPILNIALPLLTKMARAAEVAFQNVSAFMRALFPKANIKAGFDQAASIDAQSGAVDGLGDSLDATGKKAKKAANSLASFDEINSLGSGSKDDEDDAAGDSANSGVGLGMGDGIEDETTKISSKIQEMANKVKQAFGEMTTFIVQHKEIIIAALGGIATAFATLLVIKGVSTTFQLIGAAISAILSPIGLLVIALATLAGAFIYLWRNNEEFRTGVIALWEDIKVKLSAAWEWIAKAAGVVWDGLKSFWASNGDDIKSAFVASWDGIKTFFKNTFDFINTISLAIWGGMQAFWKRWGDDVTRIFTSIWNTISSLMIDIFTFIADQLGELSEFWNKYWPSIAEALINAWKVIWFFLEPFVGAIIKGLQLAWEAFADLLSGIWDSIKNIVSGALDVIMGLVKVFIGVFTLDWETLWDGIKQATSGATDAIHGIIKLVFTTILGTIKVALEAIHGLYSGMMETLRDNSKSMWEGISSIISNVWDGIVRNIKNSINTVTGMINTFIDKFNSIKISVPGFTNPITGGVIGGFEIGMPQIPKLPMLKRGGIVDGATNMGNYIAGEAGSELIMPLENSGFVDKVASALGTAVLTAMQMSNNGNKNNSGTTNLIIDGVSLARVIAPYLNKENIRIGGGMITTS
ncbi:hypothetical protein [Bacillus sp. 3255]|uniref:phage tail protein n=1 Tax=Bacillus sp. 3255 TaxID=2817904 RepID=UPI00285B122E|nr:hypothetical protein [Bacillus sp. 3255]MDR6883111.1 phage-related protein [Bacillus sp. 3255]